ncbi:Uncharacterised protein [Bordetella pertussis]|nr:Uncharacterised protein [Bordetella pertussis]
MGRARGGRVGGRHGVTAFILSLTSAYVEQPASRAPARMARGRRPVWRRWRPVGGIWQQLAQASPWACPGLAAAFGAVMCRMCNVTASAASPAYRPASGPAWENGAHELSAFCDRAGLRGRCRTPLRRLGPSVWPGCAGRPARGPCRGGGPGRRRLLDRRSVGALRRGRPDPDRPGPYRRIQRQPPDPCVVGHAGAGQDRGHGATHRPDQPGLRRDPCRRIRRAR